MHPLTKAYVALAVMAGCFVFLYPKIFHPWIRIMFGGGGSPKERERDYDYMEEGPGGRRRPPQMRDREPAPRRERSSSKGTGFMGMMLPVYCIGIVLYLVYTLMKVYGKKDKEKEKEKKKGKHAQWASEFSDRLEAMSVMGKPMPGVVGPGKFDAAALSGQPRTALIEQPLEARLQPKPGSPAAAASTARDTHAPEEECEGEMSRAELLQASANLANVVNHSDFARLKDAEIDSLRRRLEETEKMMARMLLQMNAAQTAIGANAGAAPAKEAPPAEEKKTAEATSVEKKSDENGADENANESSSKQKPEEESGLRQRKPVAAKDSSESDGGSTTPPAAPAEPVTQAKAEAAAEKKADKPEKSE